MLKYTQTNSKFAIQVDFMRTNDTFPTFSREPSLKTRGFRIARGTTMKKFQTNLWDRLCPNLFPQREWKRLADPMVSYCVVNWGWTFSPLLNCYNKIWEIGYNWWDPDLIFHMIGDNPNVSLGIVASSLYTRIIALKDDCHKKSMDMLAYTPLELNFLETRV